MPVTRVVKWRSLLKKKNREAILISLFAEFNHKFFANKLPSNLGISWSHKLNSRAGQTSCLKNENTNIAKIVLSTVHIRSNERLQETLIHEMCHCAEWLLDKVNPSHGNSWKKWINAAKMEFPNLSLTRTCNWEAIHKEHSSIMQEPQDFLQNKHKYAQQLFEEFNIQIFLKKNYQTPKFKLNGIQNGQNKFLT